MTSTILFEDLKIFAFHGVLPEETMLGTYYLINAEIRADLWKATETDDLNDTINYALLNDIIHQEMAIPSKLMEHVAGRIMRKIHERFPEVSFIWLKITKTAPPMRGEMKGVSVAFEKSFTD